MDIINDQNPDINIYNTDDVQQKHKEEKQQEITKFTSILQLRENQDFLSHLTKLNFIKLTPIQQQSIPILLTNSDTILSSQTGSGKTLAFLIPLVLKLNSHANIAGIRSVILSPTRELAVQTHRVLKQLISYQPIQSRLRLALITGGESLTDQFTVLSQNIDVIIACPGRLQFIISQVPQLQSQLKSVSYVVIDECDQMFEQQLIDQVSDILQKFTRPQIVLCSATLPDKLTQFSDANLRKPKLIQNELKTFPEKLAIFNIFTSSTEKEASLIKTVQKCFQHQKCKMLIFVASQYHCIYLQQLLEHFKFKVSHINRQLDQTMRNMLIRDFNSDVYDILISTDLTARGIDIPALKVVINYNFPTNFQTYLNRGGRTARNNEFDESELCYAIQRSREAGKNVFMDDIIDFDKKLKLVENEFLTDGQTVEQLDIKRIKEQFNNLFEKMTDDEKMKQKAQIETKFKICKEVVHKIKQYPEILTSIKQYRDLLQYIKINNVHGINCFMNNLYVNSNFNNNFAGINQQSLDQIQNVIMPIGQSLQSRQSMINSMIQIRKQMKDAEQRCVDEGKQFINNMNHKRSLSIFFEIENNEQQESIQDIIDEEKLHQIQAKLLDIQPSMKQLQQKAINGDKQAAIQLELQKQIDEKKYIKEEAQKLIIKENKQQDKTKLKYNDPKLLMQMDEMIKLQNQDDNKQFTQLVSSTPTLQRDQIQTKVVETQGEEKRKLPTKIWNKDKQRYVNRDLYDIHGKRKRDDKKEDKQKDLYAQWKQKSGLSIQSQGSADNTNAKHSHDMLKFQGMSRQQKRKFQSSSTTTTTLKDKQKLNMQLRKDRKDAGKVVTKAEKIQQIAKQVKAQGKDWQKEKQKYQNKQNIKHGQSSKQFRK